MRQEVRIEMQSDPRHKNKVLLVLRLPCGSSEILASDLLPHIAARMVIPVRKAFLSGVQWMRDDAASYIMTAHPSVIC